MLPVSRIMTRDVVTVSPDLGLRDAMELFVSRHITGAPVVAGGKVTGVVTLTDLVGLAATVPGAPVLRAASFGSGEEESVVLPPEGEEPPSAYFTDFWEDAGADFAERVETPDTPEWNVIDAYTVRDAMTESVLRLPPDADLRKAAEFMQQHKVHRVLIMEGDSLEGILTTSDIARAVSEHQVSERRYIFGKPQYREDGSWW